MKIISISIFDKTTQPFEIGFYLRGIYWNARLAKLLYPGWEVIIHAESKLFKKYRSWFQGLSDRLQVHSYETPDSTLCGAMLWRMHPLFWDGYATHVISRDADAILTYRESQAVHEWVDSGLGFHGITDNPAHSIPLMGGMVGFRTDHFRQTFPQWKSLDDMTKRWNLSQRGSDQQLLMADIYPKAKGNMMGHFFDGCKEQVKITKHSVSNMIPGVDPKLWEANLTCKFIGSAGAVDMEVLRFLKRFDPVDYTDFEKQFPDIFYWVK